MRTRRSPSSSDLVPSGHQTVLLHEAVSSLAIASDDTLVDATLGGGGHAKELSQKLGREGLFIGFDLDSDAISRAEVLLSRATPRTILIPGNFRNLKDQLEVRGVANIQKALFDLGWSSNQLEAGRGFSFLKDEPLLMTFASKPGENAVTAATIVNEWSEESIADILFGWGEERYSRRIAKAIVAERARKPFKSSLELANAIRDAVPSGYRRGRIHPATRSFQALRIAVNDELGALEEGLRGAWEMLTPGGRIAVISFHSIEDRIVKRKFLGWEKDGKGKRITKKPMTPNAEELHQNPRARSAKLRVIEKNYDTSHNKN